LVAYGVINGILAATGALAGLYIVTALFNLPTGIKLAELSQSGQPLLQRLLREAPGTYQHSLQVANLAEQAANAIGANADLVRVAAMYHDIGKMLNAAFFTENQVEGVNPHDVLNDPARSADIIISHVTDGEKMARQYRLPTRIRDFILEHHGTQVLYFYDQAVEQAGSDTNLDKEQFTYPGPRPRSRETGILMLADSCEAAVRSRKPSKKQEIAEIIQQIFDKKIDEGQLDDSGLTLTDIKVTQKIFVDMLQAVFHPRISYPAAVKPAQETQLGMGRVSTPSEPAANGQAVKTATHENERKPEPAPSVTIATEIPRLQTREVSAVKITAEVNDEPPLPDVPPLPRTGVNKVIKLGDDDAPPIPNNQDKPTST
jgi:putative nucleotidyltransferase with HDIG domain